MSILTPQWVSRGFIKTEWLEELHMSIHSSHMVIHAQWSQESTQLHGSSSKSLLITQPPINSLTIKLNMYLGNAM